MTPQLDHPETDREDDEDLLSRSEASAYLAEFHVRLKPATLARMWCVGAEGPPCRHVRGRPLYPREELRAWALRQRTSLRTSKTTRGPPTGEGR